ncbi:thymidylate synthase [Seohaeicola saemankumensis]|uniref:Thymidylate synthase n=1 Tax=Seohaeicola saemankumensis TaxID=481181 RepID=A0ABW3TAR9_9RHOB
MNKLLGMCMASAILAGCSGNPFTPILSDDAPVVVDTPATPVPDPFATIPAALANNLQSATYDADAGTLVLRLTSLSSGTLDATYTRTPALDRPGYQAYTLQDDPLDRHVTAMVARSSDVGNSVQAGAAADGGQFNTFFSGGFYERNDPGNTFVKPTSGLVSYAGTYAGQTNINAPGDQLLPVDPAVDTAARPAQSAQVVGTIFLNVDFANNTINGAIFDRSLIQLTQPLPDLALRVGNIATDGTFYGNTVNYRGVPEQDIGDYGGIFGGTDASAVGGVVALTEFDGPSNSLGYQGERETGVFVLSRCGATGSDPLLCANAN